MASAAAATGAIGSSRFSASIYRNALRCPSSAHIPLARAALSHHALRHVTASENRLLRAPPACVAQEEAASTEEADVAVEEVESPVAVAGEDRAEEAASTKLYFGNLPYSVDSAQLAGIIQDHASPELIEVLYNRETGRSRGFAFVTMSSIEDCQKVIQNLDGSQYMGRILRVNLSDKPKPKEPLYPETEHKLFVGNLSWSLSSETLTRAFQEYGNVVGARVLYDGESGRSRGYGFVCYATKEEMEAALQSLDGMELEGRPIRVSLAEGKRSRNDEV